MRRGLRTPEPSGSFWGSPHVGRSFCSFFWVRPHHMTALWHVLSQVSFCLKMPCPRGNVQVPIMPNNRTPKMNEMIALGKIARWERVKALVLDSVSSPITKRVYNMALNELDRKSV